MRWRSLTKAVGAAVLVAAAVVDPGQSAAAERWAALAEPLFDRVGRDGGQGVDGVQDLAQDRDGFIWAVTSAGLARFDGYQVRLFRPDPADPGALPGDVLCLHVDAAGRLWVGTAAGAAARYDPVSERFVAYQIPGAASGARVDALADDGAGGLWIATLDGLDHLDVTGAVIRVPGLPVDAPGALLLDRQGTLWIGGQTGLARRVSGTEGFEAVPIAVADPTRGGVVEVDALAEDSGGTVWLGTAHDGLGRVDPTLSTAHIATDLPGGAGSLADHAIAAIAEAAPGVLWIATDDGIVAVDAMAGQARRIRQNPLVADSLEDNVVMAALRARDGLMWVGTRRGLSRHDPAAPIITVPAGLGAPAGTTNAAVNTVMVGPDDRIWLGVEYAGLEVLDPVKGRVAVLRPDPAHPDAALPSRDVIALAANPDGSVWVGTLGGLYRVDRLAAGATRIALPLPDLYPEAASLQLLDRDLWIGTPRGLVRHDRRTGADRLYPLRLDGAIGPVGNINAILPRSDGRLWVGSSEALYLFAPDGGGSERILPDRGDPGSLSNRSVTALIHDREGRLWAGTDGGGIDVLDADDGRGLRRFRHIDHRAGLPSDHVDALLLDRHGQVWASTDDGLAVIDPDRLAVRALRREDGARIGVYGIGSADITASGELLFGGRGGLTVVRPDRAAPPAPAARVVVTGIRIGERPVPAGRYLHASPEPIVVAPADRGFEVTFAALDYAAPEHSAYAYRLDGVDPDWIATDASRRRAAYAGLAPGNYRLLLRGSNRDGRWSEPLALAVHVLPAWYQTLWFRLAEAAAALAAVAIIVRIRTAMLRRRQRDLERQVAEQITALAAAHAAAVAGEAEARQAKDAAEAATQAKSRFLAVISHEVRTPLNGVLGMLQMLDAAQLDRQQRRYLEIAEDSGRTLRSLIDGILDFERLQARGETLDISDFDLHGMIAGVIEQLRGPAAAKGLSLDLALPDDVPALIRSDPIRLGRVLLNLVGNAIKFTAQGGVHLAVGLEPADRLRPALLSVAVADTGIGIAPEMHAAIFQDFVQADDSIARRFGGTGLGLAICRRIAELMGGSLTVESALGVGSTFRLVVPVAIAAGPAAAPEPALPAPAQRVLSVLVVDDEAVNRLVAEGLLGRLGHRATLADNAEAGIAAGASGDFDVVLMDLHMPGIDGLEAVRRIRGLADRGRAAVRMLAMTADATSDSARHALAAGFEALVIKPLDLALLQRAIEQAPPQPAAAPAAPSELLDDAFLSRQWEALGPARLVKLGRLFHRISRQTLAALDAAHDDRTAVAALAHRLRSAAGALGLRRLDHAAAVLEASAPGAPGADIAAMIATLRTLRQSSLAALAAAARGRTPAQSGAQSGGRAPVRSTISR